MKRSGPNNALLSLCAALLCASGVNASVKVLERSTPTLGETFPIAEPDTLQEIKTAAAGVDWRSWMRQSPDRASAFRSARLPRAVKSASRLFDPTYVAPEDVRDETGRVLIARGARANVYERIKVPGRYIVIEPTAAHYRWLQEVAQPTSRDKVLLANGNVYTERQKTKLPLYLLDARFIERFGLRAVPSIVAQEGTRLRVTEYALKD